MTWQQGDIIKIQYGSRTKERRLDGDPEQNRGAEGFVVPLVEESDIVVKIFHHYDDKEYRQTIEEKQRKISSLVQFYQQLHKQSPNVCWPKNLAFDAQNRFCGFTMRRVQGTSLSDYGRYDGRGFRVITKDLLVVLRNVLETIDQTHNTMRDGAATAGILIGDIQPKNFIIDLKTKRCNLIDVDSFQIGRYRCDLNFPNYHSPERLLNNGTYDRDIYEEYYVVSYLLLETLTGGAVRPYQYINRPTDPNEAIRQGFFALTRNPNLANRVAKAYWEVFPEDVRELFRRAFDVSHPANGDFRTLRPTIEQWQFCLNNWINNFEVKRQKPDLPQTPKVSRQTATSTQTSTNDTGSGCLSVFLFLFIIMALLIWAYEVSAKSTFPESEVGVQAPVRSFDNNPIDEMAPVYNPNTPNIGNTDYVVFFNQKDIGVPSDNETKNEPKTIREVGFEQFSFDNVKYDNFERKTSQEIKNAREEAEGGLEKEQDVVMFENVQKNDVEETVPKFEIERKKKEEQSVSYIKKQWNNDHESVIDAETRRNVSKEQDKTTAVIRSKETKKQVVSYIETLQEVTQEKETPSK